MSAKNICLAFGVGLAAGAAVALLYAPESGARTRKRLGRTINDGIEEGVESLEHAADYLREQAEVLSKQAQKAIERTRGQVDGVVSDAVKNVRAFM